MQQHKHSYQLLQTITSQHSRALLLLLLLMAIGLSAPAQEAPSLGDEASSTITLDREQQIGDAWLRALRSQAPVLEDPLLQDYFEHLVYRLASHSDLSNPQLTTVMINHNTINAFAVPGGIIGIHSGLLIHAASEDQLASVIAHELGHLSQRHFIRSQLEQKKTGKLALSALLASIIIANSDTEAGIATMISTQAAATQQGLRYSRILESEADRIGMQTLVNAKINPQAMPDFFTVLHKKNRLNSQLPEFLLTHPLTDKRISDAQSRANQSPITPTKEHQPFLLAQARALALYALPREDSIDIFQAALARSHTEKQRQANRYGLVLSLTRNQQYPSAQKVLMPLLSTTPTPIAYHIAQAELLMHQGKTKQASQVWQQAISLNPNNYPLSLHYAEALINSQSYERAIALLTQQSRSHSERPAVWKKLAKAYGLSHRTAASHYALGEYYFLTGNWGKSEKQLKIAIQKSKGRYHENAKYRYKLKTLAQLQKGVNFK